MRDLKHGLQMSIQNKVQYEPPPGSEIPQPRRGTGDLREQAQWRGTVPWDVLIFFQFTLMSMLAFQGATYLST